MSIKWIDRLLVGAPILWGVISLFDVSSAAGFIAFVDRIGGSAMPLLGWMLLGAGAGTVMGVASRALDFGWFGRARISRVPDIRHLREGEEVAARLFRWRMAAAFIGVLTLAAVLKVGYSRHSGYDVGSDYGGKAAAIAAAAAEGKMTILNAALDAAARDLQSDPRSGLRVLIAIASLREDATRPDVELAAKIARQYLDAFREETEKLVAEGAPTALKRSEAFLYADRMVAAKWIGRLYQSGFGGAEKNLSKAFSFYGEAARSGDKTAAALMDKLAQTMVSDKDEAARMTAFRHLESKAKNGGPNDHYWLGKWYAASGNPSDRKNAEKWLVKALLQESDEVAKNQAFSALAEFKDVGPAATRVLDDLAAGFASANDERSKKVAYGYLERRANAGYPGAMLLMGLRFLEGDGIAKDAGKAHDWLLKAALQNKDMTTKDMAFTLLDGRRPSSSVDKDNSQSPHQTEALVRAPPAPTVNVEKAGPPTLSPPPIIISEKLGTPGKSVDVANKRIMIPANSHPNQYVPQGWSCDAPAYKQVGSECVYVQKPANSHHNQYVPQGWSCDAPAYKQVGSECVYVQKPANSHHNQYVPQGWSCDAPAYKQVGSECVYVQKPANSHHNQYVPQGWSCDAPAYKQVGDECWKLESR